MSILYIIDMDGFMVANRFVCKELASINIETGAIERLFFQVGSFHRLEPKDKVTAKFVTANVHGLAFSDEPNDLQQHQLGHIIAKLALAAAKRSSLIAFKGGNFERQLLLEHSIENFVDLEALGCPRVDLLAANQPMLHATNKCARHRYLKNRRRHTLHCPGIEVLHFAEWYKNDYLERIEPKKKRHRKNSQTT